MAAGPFSESPGSDGGWAGAGFEQALGVDHTILREKAAEFLEAAGLHNPNEDAIDQLCEAFLPALKIICERDHAPDGGTWRMAGWKAQLHELFKKADRLRYRAWARNIQDDDSAIDIINYAGFYLRGHDTLTAWGQWGEPGQSSEIVMHDHRIPPPIGEHAGCSEECAALNHPEPQ